jgi:hypothetical protein
MKKLPLSKFTLLTALGLLSGLSGNNAFGIPFRRQDTPAKIVPANISFKRFSVGLDGGLTFPYTDIKGTTPAPVFGGSLSYQPLSFLRLTGELQLGWLKGAENDNEINLNFKNRYYYAALTGQLFPFKIRKYPTGPLPKFLDYIFVGTGLAVTKNSAKAIKVNNKRGDVTYAYNGLAVLIPAEIGINIPVYTIPKRQQIITLDLDLRQHFSFSDQLDGYQPNLAANKKMDVYNQVTIGLSYRF